MGSASRRCCLCFGGTDEAQRESATSALHLGGRRASEAGVVPYEEGGVRERHEQTLAVAVL